MDFAVGKAREAFEQGHWSRLHPSARKDVLIRLCKLITRDRRELAVMESLDSGKPIRDCELIDIPETDPLLKWHAEAVDKIYDQTGPVRRRRDLLIVREPIGVVGAILPWNFPLLMMAWKIGPALAAGNSVIVKPAEQTSLTALRLAESRRGRAAARRAAGAAGRRASRGRTAGPAHGCRHGGFTGSTETGQAASCAMRPTATSRRSCWNAAARTRRVVLEDAENLDHVASMWSTRRSGTWARTARPPRA